mmetsp:Transcript_14512/g.31567  ORF Transcript_14512/g.31567 Transcript_14512/m.31567 type:complete len:88 (-) Transcript_14512:503-766(-)
MLPFVAPAAIPHATLHNVDVEVSKRYSDGMYNERVETLCPIGDEIIDDGKEKDENQVKTRGRAMSNVNPTSFNTSANKRNSFTWASK